MADQQQQTEKEEEKEPIEDELQSDNDDDNNDDIDDDDNDVDDNNDVNNDDDADDDENDCEEMNEQSPERTDNEGDTDYLGDNEDDEMISDELFRKVLKQLVTLKSKKKQSKVIPSSKKFLQMNMNDRSRHLTKTVTKNLLHLLDFVVKGKLPIDISVDNKRFMRHLLDKRTPHEDVAVALVEDFRTHVF